MSKLLTIILIIISIIVWIIFGWFSYRLREEKGYEGGFIIGFLFGVFALIYSAGLPDLIVRNEINIIKKELKTLDIKHTEKLVAKKPEEKFYKKTQTEINEQKQGFHLWRCPKCGEMISNEPCPKCGYKNET